MTSAGLVCAQVRSINKVIRDEDCYKGLDAMVKAFTTSLPLVAELRSPAMRDRHWAALMAATKKDINITDPSFSLQHLLDLELHKFEEEVGEIVDQAGKEEKMEVALARLNETWEKMEFQFVQHKQTDIYTIRMAEEDFEAMEDNQVQVQVRTCTALHSHILDMLLLAARALRQRRWDKIVGCSPLQF